MVATSPPRPDVDPPIVHVIRDDATADETLNTFLALGSVYAELCRSPEFRGEVLARDEKEADDVGGAVDEDKEGAEGDSVVAEEREEEDEATSDDNYDCDDEDSISCDDSTVPPPPPPYPTETESVMSLPPPPPPPPPSRQATSKVEVRDTPKEEEEKDEPSAPKGQTLYDLLEVDRNTCTKDDIKRAHRKAAMKYHPDRLSGNNISIDDSEPDHVQTFAQIQHAYEVLSDEVRKLGYDAELRLAELREELEEEKAKCRS